MKREGCLALGARSALGSRSAFVSGMAIYGLENTYQFLSVNPLKCLRNETTLFLVVHARKGACSDKRCATGYPRRECRIFFGGVGTALR